MAKRIRRCKRALERHEQGKAAALGTLAALRYLEAREREATE